MAEKGALLLLGEPKSEGGDELSMALKSFFRAGEKGDFSKAAEAFREAVALVDDEEDTESTDDESDDDDELML